MHSATASDKRPRSICCKKFSDNLLVTHRSSTTTTTTTRLESEREKVNFICNKIMAITMIQRLKVNEL